MAKSKLEGLTPEEKKARRKTQTVRNNKEWRDRGYLRQRDEARADLKEVSGKYNNLREAIYLIAKISYRNPEALGSVVIGLKPLAKEK